jgi:MtfA peptidase
MIWSLVRGRELPIEPARWRQLVRALPFLQGFDAGTEERFRSLVARFLTEKTITGAQGVEVDDDMRLSIAAQACLPVLKLGLEPYRDFVEVIVYPSAFLVKRQVTDDIGLVHEFDDVLAGEAMDQGPLVLSWDDIAGEDAQGNVVVHEFVHKIDLSDGTADGRPPMPAALRRRWHEALEASYDAFVTELDAVESAIPSDVDPESDEAAPYYDTLPLDPYAATDEAEFFAVAAESFFVDPEIFAEAFPALHTCFVEYFGDDPCARLRDTLGTRAHPNG